MTTEVEIIESEVSLENEITGELVKNNVTDAIIAGLKEKFEPLVLRGKIQNKEEFSEIVDARKECKGWRIITTKVCKKGREKAVKIQKGWIAKEAEVIARISVIEDPLEKLEDEWTTEQERVKAEKKRMQEEQLANRQQDLSKMGVLFSNGNFELGDVSYEYALVKESDEPTYQIIYNAFKAVFDANEAERLEKLKKDQEAAAELQRQKDELAREQKELAEAKAEIERQRLQSERVEQEKKNKEAEEYKAKIDSQNKRRINQVMSLGMSYKFDDNAFSVYDVFVAQLEISTFTDDQWNELIEKITPVIIERKLESAKKLEEKRLVDIETAKQEAIKKEQERKAEEERLAEIRRKQDEEKRLEELAKASDKVKYADLISKIEAIEFPDMRSGQYRKKVAIIREKIEEIYSL